MAENPQLEIGYSGDIYVNTLQGPSFPELAWKEPTLADVVPRRVLRLPLFIRAITEWRTTPVAVGRFLPVPGVFVGFPTFPNLFSLALSNSNGDILREALITPVFLSLLKGGEINLRPDEVVYAHVRLALFDLASYGNQDVFATLLFDPLNQYPGAFATEFSFWRLGSHSVEVLG